MPTRMRTISHEQVKRDSIIKNPFTQALPNQKAADIVINRKLHQEALNMSYLLADDMEHIFSENPRAALDDLYFEVELRRDVAENDMADHVQEEALLNVEDMEEALDHLCFKHGRDFPLGVTL